MTESHYDPEWVSTFFDAYGEREWERLVQSPAGEISLYVHSHYLRENLRTGDNVLEVGAGAGRFTQVLVELGCEVTVLDLSPTQLELNRTHATALGFEAGVVARIHGDMCRMDTIPDARFDAVVAYGGPLSYVFDHRDTALREMLRVLKPGGKLLLSVMCVWGSVHQYLTGVLPLSAEENAAILSTGDLCPATHPSSVHHCHLFRATELREWLIGQGVELVGMSACNCLSAVWNESLVDVRADPGQWACLLELEVQACREPGCLDMGTHLIAVVRKTQ